GTARAGHGASGDADDARRRLDQPVDRAQERRLAGPALAEDDDELAGADGEVDPLEGYCRGREDDGEPRDLDHRVHADPSGVSAGEAHLAEKGLRVTVLNEPPLDQEHHRVDVARRAGRIHEGDRLAPKVLELPETGVSTHEDARRERALPVP